MKDVNWLKKELSSFANKYYMNIFWQRFFLFVAVLITSIFIFSYVEYSFWFGTNVRVFLFWGLISLSFLFFNLFLIEPIFFLIGFKKRLSQKDFALKIGQHFSQINDRILNVLELDEDVCCNNSSDLIFASIRQKLSEINFFNFSEAINRHKTRRMLPLVITPITILLLMALILPEAIVKPLNRISNYRVEYIKPSPFDFIIQNEKLITPQNRDFTISVKLVGSEIPQEVFIQDGVKQYRMNNVEKNLYEFTFRSIKASKTLSFYAGGFESSKFQIEVFKLPSIVSYSLHLSYPQYTGKQNEVVNNINSLNVPRGTNVKFLVLVRDADDLLVIKNKNYQKSLKKDRYFVFENTFKENENIKIVSKRNNIKIADSLEFNFNVIQDEYPSISVLENIDSSMFMLRYFNGKISDDYGFSKLKFEYKFYKEDGEILDSTFVILINLEYNFQEFYNAFDFSLFNPKPGEKIEYFFTVFDNDTYLGPKSSKSKVFSFKMPTKEEMKNQIEAKSQVVSEGLKNMMSEAEKLQKEIDDFLKKNIQKRKLDWEDREKLKELLAREKILEENIKKAGEQNTEKLKMSKQLNEFNEKVFEKNKLIDELMNQIMDDEFKKILDELRKMLDKTNNDINLQLEKLNQKNEEILKNLDQTISLLERMKTEEDIRFLINDLEDVSKDQKNLSESKENITKKIQDQEKIADKFNELKQKSDSINIKNKNLEDKFKIDFLQHDINSIDSTMKLAADMLNKSKENKAAKSQQDAADQIQKLADKLEQMLSDMEMEQNAEDIGLVREILKNLILISFQQEELMKHASITKFSDPKYFDNLRKQKRLDEALTIVEDSLRALGKRNPMVNNFISDELSKINYSRKKVIENLNSRYINYAVKEQQYIMMGVNNLALLLSDALKQMQMQSNQQKQQGQKGNSSCKNSGNNQGKGKGAKPSAKTLRQLQEQLNKQMEQLKNQMEKGQKSGAGQPGWSEQFAKMAAQQEAIRKAMQEYQQQLNSEGANGSALNKTINDMEKTEEDLVNKKLTNETINRQKQIETRLLESEKADMEREKDPKRKSEEAKFLNNSNQNSFFKYNNLKRNNSEILKTVSPNLNPYYKQKVNEYLYKSKEQ